MQWVDRVGRRLKLRDLHILLTVVERGSMAKAAADLAISQPAVSKAIADLEHTFGLRLLDRGRGGVEPTVYGSALAARGRVIFDELKHGVDELAFLADPSEGSLRIGITESVAAGLLPAVVERFSRERPRIRLDVAQTVISKLHYGELRDRSIDLMLSRIPSPFDEADLEAEVVYDDPVVVVAGRRSKWARMRKLTLAELAGERWILPPSDTMPGSLTAELFRASGVEPPRAPVTTLSIHLWRRLAAEAQFVTMIPMSVLRFGKRDPSLKVLPIKLPVQRRPVGVITLKNRALGSVAELFIECVRRTVKRELDKGRPLSRNDSSRTARG
ncbi:MAG: LysR family transcriptional regulator [Rhodospirillales bacterium]|nr:LysR family transcriptional regulator [Rhodospirillales bacterium]